MIDAYFTISGPSTGLFKDKGSKFFGYAFPVDTEEMALAQLENLRKEHFKARHHCFAWRIGVDGDRFRANDDGEPSGTAGKPILGQIDSRQLTNTCVIVVRYFGGTLLGASGLIHAYREAAAEALNQAVVVEKIMETPIDIHFDYGLMPDLMNALKKANLDIRKQDFGERGYIQTAIRRRDLESGVLQLKSSLLKVAPDYALTLDWPLGMEISF